MIEARRRLWTVVGALFGCALAAAYLTWPFATDQGIFVWVASKLLAGGALYRDAWDTKGPAAYYLTVPAVWAFGRHQWGIRLYDLFWVAAGAAAVYRIVREVAPARPPRASVSAWMAAALYCLWYFSLDPYNTAQPDGWVGALLAAGAVAALGVSRRRGRGRRSESAGALAWGACVGVATLAKPTYGVFGLAILAYVPLRQRAEERGWRPLLADYAAAALGFLAPLAACVVWFAHQGALRDLQEVYLRYALTVYARIEPVPAPLRVRLLVEYLLTTFGLALPVIVAGAVAAYDRRRAEAVFVLAWTFAALANVLVQGHFDALYRGLALYPPLAVLAGLGVAALLEWRELASGLGPGVGPPARHVTTALLTLLMAGSAFGPLYHVFRWTKYVTGRSTTEEYYTPTNGPEWGWYGGPESLGGVSDYMRARTAPSDGVLVWGSQVGVNFLSGRETPERFAWSGALTYGGDTPFLAAYRHEFMARLVARPPLYIGAFDQATCSHHAASSYWCLKSFPELEAFVRQRYRQEAHIYAYDVFRRVD